MAYTSCTCRGAESNYRSVMYIELLNTKDTADEAAIRSICFGEKDGFTVEGANGAEAVAYDVWVWQPAELPAGMRVGIQFLNK